MKRKDWINLSRSTNEMKMGFNFKIWNSSRHEDETKRPLKAFGTFVKNKTKGARYFNAVVEAKIKRAEEKRLD